MIFAFFPSKRVSLFIPRPQAEVEKLISENIENRASFFAPDPEKPFNGKLENHRLTLGLNDYSNSKLNPFYDFSGKISVADGGTLIELQFKTPISDILVALGCILAGAVLCFRRPLYFIDFAIVIGLACVFYLILMIKFNHKMNFAVDELAFLFDFFVDER